MKLLNHSILHECKSCSYKLKVKVPIIDTDKKDIKFKACPNCNKFMDIYTIKDLPNSAVYPYICVMDY